jgi:hypothetical protein
MTADEARAVFEIQARYCDELGSPFTAVVCRLLAERLTTTSRFGARVLTWPGRPRDNLPLRTAGALHHLARSGDAADLAAVYPPNAAEREALWAAIEAAIATHDARLTAFLDSPPQTNEVGRSGALLGMLLHVAEATGLPLRLVELGASAGLNLDLDAYRYDLGECRRWGPPSSPVEVACAWSGVLPPLAADLRVVERAGCDRNPLDPASREDQERLLAYIWPRRRGSPASKPPSTAPPAGRGGSSGPTRRSGLARGSSSCPRVRRPSSSTPSCGSTLATRRGAGSRRRSPRRRHAPPRMRPLPGREWRPTANAIRPDCA